MPTLQLENGVLRAEVLPEAGGGLLRFDLLRDGAVMPIFRPGETDAALRDTRTLACYPLVPWSNRIGGGQFPFRGGPSKCRARVATSRIRCMVTAG